MLRIRMPRPCSRSILSSVLAAICLELKDDSSRPGLKFIGRSCCRTGTSCNPASLRSRSSHCGEEKDDMSHAIHRVEHFEIGGLTCWRSGSTTVASSESTFDRCWKVRYSRPSKISKCSTRSNWIRHSEPCSGPTGRTLIPRRCTIGPSTAMNSSRWRAVGPPRQIPFAEPRANTNWSRRRDEAGAPRLSCRRWADKAHDLSRTDTSKWKTPAPWPD